MERHSGIFCIVSPFNLVYSQNLSKNTFYLYLSSILISKIPGILAIFLKFKNAPAIHLIRSYFIFIRCSFSNNGFAPIHRKINVELA